jgi:predicted TIM-barrel fold metal-dependent hydrolase
MPRPFALLCLVCLLVSPSCIGCSKRSAKPHQASKVAPSEPKRAATSVGAPRVPPNATLSDDDAGASDPDAGRPTTLDVSNSSDVAASLVTPSWHRPGYTPPAIIDFHGHLGLAGAERIKRVMRQNGVELIINLSGGSGRRKGIGWQYGMALAQALDGRVINFANVDWSGCCGATWADREVARLRFAVTKLGYKGLKISKGLGLGVTDEADKLVAVEDVRLDPLWHEAARHHLPVTIHVADPKAFWEPLNPKNERWTELRAHPAWSYHGEDVPSWGALLDAAERMYKRNHKTTFVAVHFGNAGEDPDRVDKMLRTLPNVHIDIAARVGEFGRHAPEKMRKFFIKHQDRIVFGTDIGISDGYLMLGSNGEVEPTDDDVQPFYNAHFRYLEGKERQIAHPSPIQGEWKVDAIALPAPVLQKVYRDNALKLLAKVKPTPTVTGSK